MAETFDWSKLRVELEGETVVAPCLAFTLWFRVTDFPVMLDFDERVMQALGSTFTHYKAEDMKRPAKITARARTMIASWLRKPADYKSYFARLQGSPDVSGTTYQI